MDQKLNIAQQLERLATLNKDGLIDGKEYSRIKKRIIDQFTSNTPNEPNSLVEEPSPQPVQSQTISESPLTVTQTSQKRSVASEQKQGTLSALDASSVDREKPIAQGGTAEIYKIKGSSSAIAKLYKDPDRIDPEKLNYLVALYARSTVAYDETHQLMLRTSFPQQVVTEGSRTIGYTMKSFIGEDYISLDYWIEQPLRSRLPTACDLLSFKVRTLASLAELLSLLHKHNMCAIDLKPSNILVHKQRADVVLLDCDSFCVLNEQKEILYPAKEMTVGYYDPIALENKTPIVHLSFEQDDFAFSVIAFQMMNNGIHPYQARYKNVDGDYNIEALSKLGIFPYATDIAKNSNANSPPPKVPKTSIHKTFPNVIREGFDRCFVKGSKRLKVDQWAALLRSILFQNLIVACNESSSNVTHEKFAEHTCGACRLEKIFEKPKNKAAADSLQWKVSKQRQTSETDSGLRIFLLLVLALVAFIFLLPK